jgi:ABC-type iron transport system FetAB ATPase subunit
VLGKVFDLAGWGMAGSLETRRGKGTPILAFEFRLHQPGKVAMSRNQIERHPASRERQRMALVRSLSFQPRVLLLDEPTAALDTASALAVEQLLRERMRSQGLAVAIVTHSPEQAARLAHRVFDVRNGQGHAR